MATDVNRILENLVSTVGFQNRTVLSVGAGGGQLIEYGREAAKVIAVDSSSLALDQLKTRLISANLIDKFEMIFDDFMNVSCKADMVLFEFSLHEMENAKRALAHAGKLASLITVLDHSTESEWVYYVNEEEKVKRMEAALNRMQSSKRKIFRAEQIFRDYEELMDKVAPQGEVSIQRIERFRGGHHITIPMTYQIVLCLQNACGL